MSPLSPLAPSTLVGPCSSPSPPQVRPCDQGVPSPGGASLVTPVPTDPCVPRDGGAALPGHVHAVGGWHAPHPHQHAGGFPLHPDTHGRTACPAREGSDGTQGSLGARWATCSGTTAPSSSPSTTGPSTPPLPSSSSSRWVRGTWQWWQGRTEDRAENVYGCIGDTICDTVGATLGDRPRA